MSRVRLTKIELKRQRDQLKRLRRYLPSLQLRQRLLQAEVERARVESREADAHAAGLRAAMDEWVGLLAGEVAWEPWVGLAGVDTDVRNVAGVDVPVFVRARLVEATWDLFATPPWVDAAVTQARAILVVQARAAVLSQQVARLEAELRLTTQRVHLFERVRIPAAEAAIRRITVALGDQRTAAFGWALIAKRRAQNAAPEASAP